MMWFHSALIIITLLLKTNTVSAQDCPLALTCVPAKAKPVLDGKLDEWVAVQGLNSSIQQPISLNQYPGGETMYKCMYDTTTIYFALQIPGEYSFNETLPGLTPAVGLQHKIGPNATFFNMGGCPEAVKACANGTVCDSYRVDIAPHWITFQTQQGVAYGVGGNSGTVLDDHYAVSPVCLLDDDEGVPDGKSEWAGAWSHTNPVSGELGIYQFELARSLTTPDPTVDVQFAPGNTYESGFAFWDPFETQDGWTVAGHYVSGCGKDYIRLTLNVTSSSANELTKVSWLTWLLLSSLIFMNAVL
jgi:hypothetical protein